jgi:iron complex transport system substrate-binding protein
LLTFTGIAVAAEVRIVDFAGREVVLGQPARRIVALAPHIVENAYSAGAGDYLVGAVSFSDYPAAARELPRVGDFRAWSVEAILALQPDLVLFWGSGNGLERVESLQRLGLPVFVTEPRALQDIAREVRAIGVLAGVEQASERFARKLERDLEELRSLHASRRELRVFYQLWNDPLQTVNGQHMISAVLELCSASNVFADAPFLAPRITLEAVLDRDPDVILASGSDGRRPAWLDNWRAYPELRAVRGNALLAVDPDYLQRPTTRLLIGARELCAKLDALRARQHGAFQAN